MAADDLTSFNKANKVFLDLTSYVQTIKGDPYASLLPAMSIALSKSLILAVYRPRIIYEIRDRPRSPKSLCGSVIEHRRAEFNGLRFDSSWGLRICSLSHAGDETKDVFLYFFYQAQNLPSFLIYLSLQDVAYLKLVFAQKPHIL